MNLVNAILIFCAIQPMSITKSDVQFRAAKFQCKRYIVKCMDKDWTNVGLNSCIDGYNIKYHPARECRNDLKGNCKSESRDLIGRNIHLFTMVSRWVMQS